MQEHPAPPNRQAYRALAPLTKEKDKESVPSGGPVPDLP